MGLNLLLPLLALRSSWFFSRFYSLVSRFLRVSLVPFIGSLAFTILSGEMILFVPLYIYIADYPFFES